MTSSENRLIVFARSLRPGTVKTRLVGLFTAEEACRLHAAMTQDVAARAAEALAGKACVSVAWSDPPDPGVEGRLELPAATAQESQPSGDLGERMALAIQDKLRQGARRVVILGSDAPTLPGDHLLAAFDSLRSCDVVIGPTHDGGYYLIGMSHLRPELFRGIPWGTREVLKLTRRKLKQAGVRAAELGTWRDVDTPEDVTRLWAELLQLKERHPAQLPPRTYEVLSRLAPGRIRSEFPRRRDGREGSGVDDGG